MKFVPNQVSRSIARKILITQKNSPRLMFAAGIVGVGVGTIMACRATLKLESAVDEITHDIKSVKSLRGSKGGYPVEESGRDLAYVYLKGATKLTKLYAPSVIVYGVSISALTGAHVTLTRRNASLTAAYALVSKSFSEYRDRVRGELGDDRELDIYHAASLVELPSNDPKSKKGELVKVSDPNKFSPYARFFDEYSRNWVKNPELNRLWVQSQQNYLNQLLQVRGHVLLNEAYDALGVDRSSAGCVVGWLRDGDGDHYIDFGMFEARNANFINGFERSILLDFNVDGVIYDKI
jgi:hypothetical protein